MLIRIHGGFLSPKSVHSGNKVESKPIFLPNTAAWLESRHNKGPIVKQSPFQMEIYTSLCRMAQQKEPKLERIFPVASVCRWLMYFGLNHTIRGHLRWASGSDPVP
ncbi:hypothetical protein PABG_11138 [Paracoccidioides brasiliensis Pb03]|nr:hypothetical protein PABG_11138 [Paracoccidioides brasiliensis Pb03]